MPKNLAQFIKTLSKLFAKKGNQLYIWDFDFIPNTIVLAYSPSKKYPEKILTSLAISMGTKLYEHIFNSEIIYYKRNRHITFFIFDIIEIIKSFGQNFKKTYK